MSNALPIRVDPQSRIPLAAQLAEQLSWLIASSALAEGDELPPARQLADHLGINFHTVRAAYQQLASDGLVSVGRGRKARVLRYDRARAASASPETPSFTIGAIVPMFAPFYAPLLDGIEAAAAHHPAMLLICNARDDPQTAVDYLDRLIAKRVDGVIAAAPLLNDGLEGRPPDHPPIVFVDDPGAPGLNVAFDLEASQFMATSHLIEHGHTRIGYVTPPREWRHVAPKYEGHQRALHAADLEPDEDLVVTVPDFTIASGTEGTNRLLELPDAPTAIAAISDELAIGAFHALTSHGLRIPHDVALTGNDGSDMAAILRPPLTTVSLPVRQAGEEAITMLEQAMTGKSPHPARVVLDVELVTRETCGCGTTSA